MKIKTIDLNKIDDLYCKEGLRCLQVRIGVVDDFTQREINTWKGDVRYITFRALYTEGERDKAVESLVKDCVISSEEGWFKHPLIYVSSLGVHREN